MKENISKEDLIKKLKDAYKNRPLLIGLSGIGGSGKSTLANYLEIFLGTENVTVVRADDFILNRLKGVSDNWHSFDWNRLIDQVLKPISNGKSEIGYDVYDWDKDALNGTRSFKATKYVIVEGVGLFQDKMDKFFDVKIWIDCPFKIALERGKIRDKKLGSDHDSLWDETWSQNDKLFMEKYSPADKADFVVANEQPSSWIV